MQLLFKLKNYTMRKKLLVMLLFTFSVGYTYAQREISGKVTSGEDGSSLPGVNVVVVGSQQGSITDVDGNYTINVSDGATLKFSYIGFIDQEIQVGNQSIIDVVMQTDVTQLSEVVVTAFGIEKDKKALGYSITEVDGQDLVEAREVNLGDALQGRVAGVNVSNVGSGVAGSSRVIIRGNTSINGNNMPLYVVDGVPMDNSNLGQAGMWGGSDWGDGLTSINPDDIENISVLKGNTAAALYGSRASNGVILITTKKGKARKGIGVEFNSNFVAETINNFQDFQQEYGHGTRGTKPANKSEAWNNTASGWGAKMDGSSVPSGFDDESRPYSYQGDPYSAFYRTGTTWTNTLALVGGSETQNFRFSASDMRNEAVTPNSGMNRQNFTLSTNSQWAKKLTLTSKIQYSREDVKNRARLSDAPGNANYTIAVLAPSINVDWLKGDPNKPGANPDGTEMLYADNIYSQNPYWAAYQFENNNLRDRVMGSALLRYDITDWLYVHGRVGMDWYTDKRRSIEPYGTGYQALGAINEQVRTYREVNMEWMLGGQKQFGEFGINAFVGGNKMTRDYEYHGLRGTNLNIPFFNEITNAGQTSIEYDVTKSGINSLFGSAEFSYGNFLFLTATGRNDWFSTLNPDLNSIFYPSVAASFVLSDVVVMPEFFSFAKIRGSWAEVGGGADPYSTSLNYSLVGQGHNGGFGQAALGRIQQGDVPNSQLTPLTVSEVEFGFDLRFFNNRIGVDYAYYNRSTMNDIVAASISGTSGYGNAVINVGELSNRGHELLISATPVAGDFRWDITFNYAYNKAEVKQLAPGVNSLQINEARSRNAYVQHRIAYTDEDTGESFDGGYGMVMAYMPQMIDGQMVLDADGLPLREGGLTVMGSGVAPTSGGINNTFSYKNFSLGFLIDYKMGGVIYSGTNQSAYGNGMHKETLVGREGGLTVSGVDENGDAVSFELPYEDPNNTGIVTVQNYYSRLSTMSGLFVYDADYVKLRQFTFGYNFPASMLSRTPFTGASLSFVGRNLWLIHSNVDNIDPESTYDNTNGQGLEWYGVPQSRTFGFNLNVKF